MTEHEQASAEEGIAEVPRQNLQGSGVWYFVEHRDAKVDESSFRLAAEAQALARKLGAASTAVILGSEIGNLAASLEPYGTDRALLVQEPHLEAYAGEAYAEVLAQLVSAEAPTIVLMAASTAGNDLAPRLAARIVGSLVSLYTEIEIDHEQNIAVRKAIHGGNAQATLLPRRSPLVATIDTQILSEPKPKQGTTIEVIHAAVRVDPKSSLTKLIDYVRADPCAVCVSEAEIVLGVGKGLGCAENIHAVQDLAQVLGASIGGSRRATDERWIDDERRIGLTGKTIAPRLYMLCGISGAFHHTLSIKEARFKVVINTDVNAPISKMADLMVIGNMQEIIPELTRQLRETLRSNR
jgi:electron transfer flavoprotein alpha subunit